MSVEITEQILEMQNYSIKNVSITAEHVVFECEKKEPIYCCPHCKQQTFSCYDSMRRLIEDMPMSGKRVFLDLPIFRLYCSTCKKVLTEYLTFLQPYQRYTNRFIHFIHHLCAISTVKEVSEMTGLHWNSVQRIDQQYLETHLNHSKWEDIKTLCIDEVSYKKHHHYLTIISDCETGQIIEIIEGRSYQNVAKVLKKIKRKARLKIKWVSVDLWKPYLKIIHQYFPNAQIVLDKFHLIGQLNKAIDTIRKDEQMTQEGEGRRILKNSRWLFLYGQENLNESQSQRLNTITNLNQNLYQAYLLKEEFRSIMNELRESEGRTAIIQWIESVMATNLEPLKKFARLIKRHLQKLLNYFVHPIASGLAEGLNNLIATVKKKAYGYRNMKYFKLKILQQNQKQLLLTHTNL
jgi:transposase